jgi:hypothetical protein
VALAAAQVCCLLGLGWALVLVLALVLAAFAAVQLAAGVLQMPLLLQ